MDLECSDGGSFTYGCSNMGIALAVATSIPAA